jgi:ligand-binding sensor domain-containing protein
MRMGMAGCALLLWGSVCGAQDLRYLSHQAWGTEEGLPQSSVHAIAQTRDGYVWVATEGGLARFDGVGFRVFGRANETAFSSDDVCCLKVDGDGLLVGTADGVVRESGGRFERVAGSVGPVALATGWNWSGAGVRFVARGGRARRNAESAAGAGMEWTVGKELSGRVQAVLVDREGLAWVGMRNGLTVLNAETGEVKAVEALKGDSVLSVFEDAEGNHWVGTETSGLHVLRRLKFRREPGLAELAVTSVVETDDRTMWVGTRDDGLRRVRNGVVDEPVVVEKLTSGVILCLAAGLDGELWVGTPDGVNVVSPALEVKKITSADGLPDDYVRALAVQGGNRPMTWVGTQKGMARLRFDGFFEGVLTTAEGLPGNVVGAVHVAGRDLLSGTSGGLSVIGPDWRVRSDGRTGGLAGSIVVGMTDVDGGELWAATADGRIGRLAESGFDTVGRFATRDDIEGITADDDGNLWLRMKRGIRRVSLRELADCEKGGGCKEPGFWYGVADGLPTDEVVAGETSGGWLARDGEMWFPTRRGVAVVDTAHLPVDTVAPPVAIERFLVDDVEAADGVEMGYGHQRLTMEYAGLSFTAPSEVRYRVRLEGFDKDWVDAGGKRSATYTNLPPARYVFRVQAANGDGVWNEAGASLRFRIVPPYWRRWWFIGLMVLLAVVLLAGLYLLRLRRLQRGFDAVLAERNRMAREIHDTLTQDFVGTSVQLDIVTQMLRRGKTEAALEQVAQTRRLVSEGLDEARQSIWELRANSSQDSLPTRLTRLVERETYRALAPKLHIGGAYRELEVRVEREVLRIAQEALQNVLRHARATETSVNLHYSDEALLLTIEDNGVGFRMDEAAQREGHFGMVGMRERAAAIDGTFEVRSEVGGGTKVSLRVAIQTASRS